MGVWGRQEAGGLLARPPHGHPGSSCPEEAWTEGMAKLC